MESEIIKWSLAYPLFNTRHHLELNGKPGIYRIRVFTEQEEPLPIQRLGGVDSAGILHIGKSINLGVRIRMFRQAAEGRKASHHAGLEFSDWHFERLIPQKLLRYDYYKTTSEPEALMLERMLHVEYRRKLLDRPPLDGTSGQTDE